MGNGKRRVSIEGGQKTYEKKSERSYIHPKSFQNMCGVQTEGRSVRCNEGYVLRGTTVF